MPVLAMNDTVYYSSTGDRVDELLNRSCIFAGQAPEAPITNLSKFRDGYLISYYAVEAMSSLVEMGVFQGTEDGYLNPYSTLTRLQMAAILHRAMT